MNGRMLIGVWLMVVLSSCIRTYTDIDLQTDPRVLRGAFTASLKYDCNRYVNALDWKPDGSQLVTTLPATPPEYSNRKLRLWNANGSVQRDLEASQAVRSVFWHPSAPQIFAVLGDGRSLERFDANTGSSLGVQTLPAEAGSILSISPDTGLALTQVLDYTVNTDGVLQAWNINSGLRLWQKNLGRDGNYPVLMNTQPISWKQDGTKLAYTHWNEMVVVDATIGVTLTKISLHDLIRALAWYGDDLVLGVSNAPSLIKRYSSGGEERNIPIMSFVYRPYFSSDGAYALGIDGADPAQFSVWKLETGERIKQFEHGDSSYLNLVRTFSPNHNFVALPGTSDTCGVDLIPINSAAPQVTLTLETPDVRVANLNVQVQYESDSIYTITGTVTGGGLDGYSVTGHGSGTCRSQGLVTDCDRFVRPAMTPVMPFGAMLLLSQADQPTIALNLSWQEATGWSGGFMLNNKQYVVNLRRAP